MYVSEICDAGSFIDIYINPILVFIFTITEMIKLSRVPHMYSYYYTFYIIFMSVAQTN